MSLVLTMPSLTIDPISFDNQEPLNSYRSLTILKHLISILVSCYICNLDIVLNVFVLSV